MGASGAVGISQWTAETTTTTWWVERFPISRRTRFEEFQIATAQFTAEAGRSGTSIINIVTKGGTYLFPDRFSITSGTGIWTRSRGRFERAAESAVYREQFGGSVGGPFKRNRAWWFGSAEYRNQNAAIESGERDFATDSILNTYALAPLRDALVSLRVDFSSLQATR